MNAPLMGVIFLLSSAALVTSIVSLVRVNENDGQGQIGSTTATFSTMTPPPTGTTMMTPPAATTGTTTMPPAPTPAPYFLRVGGGASTVLMTPSVSTACTFRAVRDSSDFTGIPGIGVASITANDTDIATIDVASTSIVSDAQGFFTVNYISTGEKEGPVRFSITTVDGVSSSCVVSILYRFEALAKSCNSQVTALQFTSVFTFILAEKFSGNVFGGYPVETFNNDTIRFAVSAEVSSTETAADGRVTVIGNVGTQLGFFQVEVTAFGLPSGSAVCTVQII